MTVLHYPARALTGDYVRAAAGIALCGGPLLITAVDPIPFSILGVLTALFAGFALITLRRQYTRVVVGDDGISTEGARRASLAWGDLRRVKLSYFSTRRDRSAGWMHLVLTGRRGGLRFDSNLDGFEGLCQRAFEAAVSNDLEMSGPTLSNFASLGLVDTRPAAGDAAVAGGKRGWGDPAEWRR